MKMSWVLYAILALLFFSGMILLFKKASDLGVKPAVIMFFVAISLALFYVGHIVITRTPITQSGTVIALLVLAGFLSYAGNLFYTKSIALAPNPGYAAALVGLQLAVIALASMFFFKSELTLIKGTGLLLAIIAGILLSL